MAENKKSVKLEVASSDLQSKSKVTSRDLKDKGTVISGNQYTLEMVQSHIYTIRGQQVMIDRDLAFLYSVETRALNQAVKRNIERFPERYMFQLTKDEFNTLRSQIATSNNDWAILKSQNVISSWGGIRKMPYAFTEYGVTMLASVLKSKSAVDVSIRIIDAFVAMRRFISANAGMFQRIERLEQHQAVTDEKIDKVLQRMDELAPAVTPEQIFATGCVWDAWSYVSQLVRSAKRRIILIDNFVDERVLTLLTKRGKGVTATIHSRYTEQFKLDLEKHNAQYEPIEFIQLSQKAHDRFLIIDDDVYLMGASVKDMGASLCAITKMEMSPDTILALL